MGTEVLITVFCDDAQKATRAMNVAFDKISNMEAMMSNSIKNSDVKRLNDAKTGKIKVSKETFEVIKKALDYGKITNGAFDITVGPLLRLWRKAESANSLPTSQALKRSLEMVGYGRIKLYPESFEVEFEKPGMEIDLGGIAKGYIVGEAIKTLVSGGITSGLISAGGDMYALGSNPEHGKWIIGIRNPLKPSENIRYIQVTDKAVSTSGHYMRFYTVAGKKYSHIVDPVTGYPPSNNVASVTLIGSESTGTDALTKAIAVLGPEKGLSIISSQPGIEAFVITWDGNKMSYFQTPGFSQYFIAKGETITTP